MWIIRQGKDFQEEVLVFITAKIFIESPHRLCICPPHHLAYLKKALVEELP